MQNIISNIAIKTARHKSFQNFAIMAAAAGIQAFNNILLGRYLSKEQFGIYSFVFLNIVILLSLVFLLGQNTSIIRYFSDKNLHHYNWKRYLLKFLGAILIPLTLASLLIKVFYSFSWGLFWCIDIGAFLTLLTIITASVLRSQGKMNTAVILEKMIPVFFCLGLCLTLFFNNSDLKIINLIRLAALSCIIPFFAYLLSTWKNGSRNVENKVYKDGIKLWEISITLLVMDKIDAFFIVKLLNFKELALYSIMIAMMQLYELISKSLWNVYSYRFAKSAAISPLKHLPIFFYIALTITTFYLVFTNILLELFFDGKYIADFGFVICFCIIGSLRILYVVPSCFIVGQSSEKEISTYFKMNIVGVFIKFFIIFGFRDYGLYTFLFSNIAACGFRTICGYFLILKNRRGDLLYLTSNR